MVTLGNDWLSECTCAEYVSDSKVVNQSAPIYISCHMSDQLPLHNQLFLNYIN